MNSAILVYHDNGLMAKCSISAGGVGPIPLYLEKTSTFLKGKFISTDVLHQANDVLQTEISPISDIRGSKEYKRLLIRQLLFAHFIKLFPNLIDISKLLR